MSALLPQLRPRRPRVLSPAPNDTREHTAIGLGYFCQSGLLLLRSAYHNCLSQLLQRPLSVGCHFFTRMLLCDSTQPVSSPLQSVSTPTAGARRPMQFIVLVFSR